VLPLESDNRLGARGKKDDHDMKMAPVAIDAIPNKDLVL